MKFTTFAITTILSLNGANIVLANADGQPVKKPRGKPNTLEPTGGFVRPTTPPLTTPPPVTPFPTEVTPQPVSLLGCLLKCRAMKFPDIIKV